MKRLIVVAILLSLALTAAAQRLPGTAIPSHYKLTLTPDLKNATFTGDEVIDVNVPKPTTDIVLNSADIDFGDVTITSGGKSQKATVTTDSKAEMATLKVAQPIPAGPANLHIQYKGILNDKLKGFYLSKTKERNYAVSQFEATDARRAFPSFDEPDLKATFDITLVVDQGDTAISNGQIVKDTPGPEAGKHAISFSTTPKMSTYLVALLVGDFKCLSDSQDGTPIRVCAPPSEVEQGKFALESAKHVLAYYDQYFAIKYAYKKLDLIAIPDFAAGAMENTAAITFRDIAILTDEKTASIGHLKGVAETVAHEMAHQWFGDLVTMDWWDDIWLNEGFATWMSSKPIAAWKPEWNIAIDEAGNTNGSLNVDASATTRPIHATANEATTPDEISQLFDGIAYGKSAAVLRMVEHYLGEQNFRAGVNLYLKKHEYANAKAADFWNAMTESSKKPVDKIMPTFVNQAGAPMLTVTSKCAGNKATLNISQTRFFEDPSRLQQGTDEIWQVPLCIKSSTGAQHCEVLTQKQQTVNLNGCPEWSYLNSGAYGYFRSNYSHEMVSKLAADAEKGLSPAERLMLLGDEWAMVRAAQHPIGEYLDVVTGMRNDRTRQVVQAYLGPLSYIADRIASPSDLDQYRAWVRNFLRPMVNELGWTPKPGEDAETRALRASVLGVMGDIGRDPQTLSEAKTLAEQYMKDPSSVDPNIAGVVLGLAALNGDAQLYDQYIAHIHSAKTPEDYYRYGGALSDFRDPKLAERTLNAALSPAVRSQDMGLIMFGVFGNDETRELAWDFFKSHFADIDKKSGGGLGGGFGGLAGVFCSEQAKQDLQNWFQQHPDPTPRAFRSGMERLNTCIRIRQDQGPKLADWLKQHAANQGE
ncbi:MAG: M1 family metallopeptidase [Terriglobales bacterium]